MSDLEGGVRLPHSNEQDPFRALRFLIPSRLEGKWGAVDWKAGGLADARHICRRGTRGTTRSIRCAGCVSIAGIPACITRRTIMDVSFINRKR